MARIAALLAVFALGCADAPIDEVSADEIPADAPPVPDFVEKVRNGTRTDERPEVGTISFGCTATLVAPDVAITAAHCVGYGSATRPGNYGSMSLFVNGQRHRYTVQRYRALSRNLGSGDIALLQLSEPVPSTVASPRPLANTTPANGSALSVWGYGCTERGYSTDWQKRRADFTEGDATNHLCPGDSGGPVFDESTGAVLRINSGYYQDRFGTDIYGHVPTHYAAVRAQVEEWASGGIPEVGDDPEEPDVGPQGDLPEFPQGEDDEPEVDEEPEVEEDEPEISRRGEIRRPDLSCGEGGWAIFDQWACTPDGRFKYQCAQGGSPVWIECAAGCRAARAGQDAKCGEDAVPQYRDDCGVWEPYPEWTCAQDARTLVRCQENRVQAYRCRSGCGWIDGPDRCSF